MHLLVIGGTRFVGRHLVEAALAAGHDVTLFNRGSNPEVFPHLEQIRGDRNDDLAPLRGRRFDAVVDTSGYLPRQVEASAGLLADASDHYTFISSISVYADHTVPFQDEDAPVGVLAEPTDEVTNESYGPLKVLCERAAEAAMPGRVLVLRPGLIVGPHDPTDRFTYWPARLARGGEVLAPGEPTQPVQWIDARDLAGWTIRQIAAGGVGTFNTVTPADRHSLGELLDACRREAAADGTLSWVSNDFLLEREVTPFTDLPMWLPSEEGNFMRVSAARAEAAGLATRPVADTVAATLAWHATRDAPDDLPGRLTAERERELLAAWHAR